MLPSIIHRYTLRAQMTRFYQTLRPQPDSGRPWPRASQNPVLTRRSIGMCTQRGSLFHSARPAGTRRPSQNTKNERRKLNDVGLPLYPRTSLLTHFNHESSLCGQGHVKHGVLPALGLVTLVTFRIHVWFDHVLTISRV